MSNETETTETAFAEGQGEDALDFDVSVDVEPDSAEAEALADDSTDKHEQKAQDIEESEYTLDLSELSADDMPYAEILTQHAKASGIEAKQASTFIIGFTKALHEYHAKQYEDEKVALRKEWGSRFKETYTQTRSYMSKLFSKAGLTDEERAMFSNPAGYRVCRKFMAAMGEKGSYSGGSAKLQSTMSTQERIDAEVVKLCELRAMPNPSMAEIETQKAKINKIAGMVLY